MSSVTLSTYEVNTAPHQNKMFAILKQIDDMIMLLEANNDGTDVVAANEIVLKKEDEEMLLPVYDDHKAQSVPLSDDEDAIPIKQEEDEDTATSLYDLPLFVDKDTIVVATPYYPRSNRLTVAALLQHDASSSPQGGDYNMADASSIASSDDGSTYSDSGDDDSAYSDTPEGWVGVKCEGVILSSTR